MILAVCARMSRQRPSVTLVVCIWLPEWVACRLIGVLLRQEGAVCDSVVGGASPPAMKEQAAPSTGDCL